MTLVGLHGTIPFCYPAEIYLACRSSCLNWAVAFYLVLLWNMAFDSHISWPVFHITRFLLPLKDRSSYFPSRLESILFAIVVIGIFVVTVGILILSVCSVFLYFASKFMFIFVALDDIFCLPDEAFQVRRGRTISHIIFRCSTGSMKLFLNLRDI